MDDVDNADLIEVAMEARDAAREAGGGGGGGTSPNPDAADAAAGACEAHGAASHEAKLLELRCPSTRCRRRWRETCSSRSTRAPPPTPAASAT